MKCSILVYLIVFLGISTAWCNEYCDDVQSLSREVEKLRGLVFKDKVKCVVLDQRDFKQAFDDTRKVEQETESEREWEHEAYKILGLMEEKSIDPCINGSLVENYEAFYDYGPKKRIVLPSWKQTSKQILVHELAHALQDQRFSLSDLDRKICRSTDSCIALAALTEGDAVLIDEEYARSHRGASGEEDKVDTGQDYRCKIPEVFTLQGSFAYGFGKLFVKRQKDMGGNEAINEAFMHPPKSTREILQKNDYSAYKGALFRSKILTVEEAPISIGRKLLYEDTFGQYTIRLMLAKSGNQEKAILAAKGWKGDRLGLFKENGDLVMLWKTSWNTYSDAKEFFDLLRNIYSNQLQVPISHQTSYFKVGKIGYLSVELRQSHEHVVLKLKRFNFELADAS